MSCTEAQARQARDQLADRLRERPWLRGIGVGRCRCKDCSYTVEVRVSRLEDVEFGPTGIEIDSDGNPSPVNGIVVVIEAVGDLTALGESAMDWNNIVSAVATTEGLVVTEKQSDGTLGAPRLLAKLISVSLEHNQ